MTIPPLKYYLSTEADQQADELIIWLYGLSPDAALRFRQTVLQEIATICQRVAWIPGEALRVLNERKTQFVPQGA